MSDVPVHLQGDSESMTASMQRDYDRCPSVPFLYPNLSTLDQSNIFFPGYTALIYREGKEHPEPIVCPLLPSEGSDDETASRPNLKVAVPSVLPELVSDTTDSDDDDKSIETQSSEDPSPTSETSRDAAAHPGFGATAKGLALNWGSVSDTIIQKTLRSAIPVIDSVEKVTVVIHAMSEALNTRFTVHYEHRPEDDEWVLVSKGGAMQSLVTSAP